MALSLAFVGDWPPDLMSSGEKVLAAMSQSLGREMPTGTVNVKLVDDAEITRLNKEYTGNAYATDVLTFPYNEEGEALEGELADIAIGIETAARQATESGGSLPEEVGMLMAHGLLHAIGYDHGSKPDRRRFEQLQRGALELAGLTYRGLKWKD